MVAFIKARGEGGVGAGRTRRSRQTRLSQGWRRGILGSYSKTRVDLGRLSGL